MKASDSDECLLCCRKISVYATGFCDHPVCYECSTRMRVLCETNECPICRSNMPLVIFTYQPHTFSTISTKFTLQDKRFQIIFEDAKIQELFELLLENKCKSCGEVFPSFEKLKEHVRRKHELFYCELCTDNLKIFTFEKKCYSRKDLARHKRVGDPDETSHRGHPLCEFCDQRYIDLDDLYRHLRREHYFCHFCDADGGHQYYKDYEYLRVHFRKDHYLCEEGDCANEKFVGAFRTEIDLKAHIAIHHSKNKSKAEAKQARMLEFEFTYAHNRPSGSSSPRGSRYSQHRKRNTEENQSRENKPSAPADNENLDTRSTQEFPYLSEDDVVRRHQKNTNSNTHLNSLTVQSYGRNASSAARNGKISPEDFPALCSTTVAVTSEMPNSQSRKINLSINRQNNAPMRTSNVSIQLSQTSAPSQSVFRERKSCEEIQSDRNKNQVPKWIPKKESSNFEDEFPKLQVRRTQPDNSTSVNTSITTTVTNQVPHPMPSTTEASKSAVDEQFVIIKSKSKKKKQNKGFAMDNKINGEKEGMDQAESISYSFPYLSKSTLTSPDPYKKNILPPDIGIRSNYMEDNSWEQKVSFAPDDFPPLAPSESIKRPPGFNISKKKTPPPGFNIDSHATINSAPLNISLSSIARQIVIPKQIKMNGISSDVQEICSAYHNPEDYERRNETLIKCIQELLSAQKSLFDEFKLLSGKFRQNKISAAEYYPKCLEILGKKGFFEIFPELVALLPDIKKQHELLAVHKTFLKSLSNSDVISESNINNIVLVCDLCQQVLAKQDYRSHTSIHEANLNY